MSRGRSIAPDALAAAKEVIELSNTNATFHYPVEQEMCKKRERKLPLFFRKLKQKRMQKDQGDRKVPSSSQTVKNSRSQLDSTTVESSNSQLNYQTVENSSSQLNSPTVESSSNQLKYKDKIVGYVVLLMLDILSNFL